MPESMLHDACYQSTLEPTHEQDALADSGAGLALVLQQCTALLAGAGLHRCRHGRFLAIPSRCHCVVGNVKAKNEMEP